METWKPIVGWEDSYEVSDLGRVRSSRSAINTFIGRILKPTLSAYGYLCVRLKRNGKGQTFGVHQLVMRAFIGPYPTEKEVNHRDGDRTNAALSNLEYVTRSENNLHAYRVLGRKTPRGRSWKVAPKYGSSASHSKLKEEQVLEILQRAAGGETQRALATCFGVDRSTIGAIKRGKNWSHLTGITR